MKKKLAITFCGLFLTLFVPIALTATIVSGISFYLLADKLIGED